MNKPKAMDIETKLSFIYDDLKEAEYVVRRCAEFMDNEFGKAFQIHGLNGETREFIAQGKFMRDVEIRRWVDDYRKRDDLFAGFDRWELLLEGSEHFIVTRATDGPTV